MSLKRPVFILGIGAQKAGTTFLHNALQAHTAVAMSEPKELHIFNSRFLAEGGEFNMRKRRASLTSLLETPYREQQPLDRRKTLNLLRLFCMQYDLDEYVKYFQELAREWKVRHVGEVTPDYQMLSAEHFRKIRTLLEPHFELRVIFLMRDPIDRLFSALKLKDRNQDRSESLAHERFANFRNQAMSLKSQYENSLAAMDAAFDKSQIHYELYEELFTQVAFNRIGRFLELEGLTPDFAEKVNESAAKGKPDPQALAKARDYFNPTYEYCMARFGEDRIRTLWKYA